MKKFVFRRDDADLPGDLDLLEDAGALFAGGERVAISERLVQDVTQPGVRLAELRAEGCVVERAQLAESEIGALVLKDVRLVGCDLANAKAHRMALVRVEFVDCRLKGLISKSIDWRDVLGENSDWSYAQMCGAEMRNSEFRGCNWQEADLQDAELSGCVFQRCNLKRAEWLRTRLENADLRGSDVDGLQVGIGDLRGAIVDAAQAMEFAKLLGVQIR
ncbi:MAG: pentapeptide repeat-containing protein [Acidobacteria bacterium]|nr:pentapeptide repeat-containing protein [Acidobacteriota bacterium]